MSRFLLLPLAFGLSLGACKCSGRDGGETEPTEIPVEAPAAAEADPRQPTENVLTAAARVGTVTGRILLEPGTILPRWSLDEIGRGAESSPIPNECGPARDVDTLPVVGVGEPTALVGVMVTATGPRQEFFDALGTWEPADRIASIESCRVRPKMISATMGDTLVLENHDSIPFLPTAGPSSFHETLLQGQSRRVELGRGGVSSIQCGFAVPCGRSEMIVLMHPVHTVTNEVGRFELKNVPADMDVELHAYHLYFEEAKQTVRVSRGGRVEVDLTIRPRVLAHTQTEAERAPRDAGR